MLIRAISDLHGNLPKVDACDLLLIAGDICPDFFTFTQDDNDPFRIIRDPHIEQQEKWLDTEFRDWIGSIEAEHIVAIAGNHDYVFEEPELIPDLPWIYLRDTEVEIDGLKLYGYPWVPNLPEWAFYGDSPTLQEKADAIPDDTDILITHGPPNGLGDEISRVGHVGDEHLASALQYRLTPRLHVFGHIHEGRGRWDDDQTAANVAILDEFYQPYYDRGIEEFNL